MLRKSFATLIAKLSLACAGLAIVLSGEFSTLKPTPHSSEANTSAVVSAKSKASVIPVALNAAPWLEKASALTSLEGFLEIISTSGERFLVQSMIDDEFAQAKPFVNLSSQYPLALLLAKGVKEFHRNTYRTNSFRGEEGYDLVVYDVIHSDGTHSEIMAYVEQLKSQEMKGSLELDKEPRKQSLFVAFNIYETNHSTYYNLYRDNDLAEHASLDSTQALAMVTHRVSASVPFMAVSAR